MSLRIRLGQQNNGSYGLRVSRAGYSADDADAYQLFISDRSTIRVLATGWLDLNGYVNSNSVYIPGCNGSVPNFIAYYGDNPMMNSGGNYNLLAIADGLQITRIPGYYVDVAFRITYVAFASRI